MIANPLSQGKEYTGKKPAGHILCLMVRDEENRETKTGLERLVPISDKLLPVVIRKLTSCKKEDLFPGAAKDECKTFGRTFLKKLKTIAGDLTMHGFRHYAASEMENNGAGSNICSAILGHATSDVHSGYLHITIAAMKDAVDKIY